MTIKLFTINYFKQQLNLEILNKLFNLKYIFIRKSKKIRVKVHQLIIKNLEILVQEIIQVQHLKKTYILKLENVTKRSQP